MERTDELLLKQHPELLEIIQRGAYIAWKYNSATLSLTASGKATVDMALRLARAYPQYLTWQTQFRKNYLTASIYLLIPLETQRQLWGDELVPWFGSNLGINNITGCHYDRNNFPCSVCLTTLLKWY